jgi:hypothetical protein
MPCASNQEHCLDIIRSARTLLPAVFTPGSDLRTLIQQNIVDKLSALDGSNPLPVGPIASDQKDMIRELVQHAIESQEQELAEAIRTGAQARVNQLKAQLSNRVANTVTSKLNRSFSFYDSWTDPVIGLRGRFNLNKTFYLTAQTDVGGFGIGSDIAVGAYAALGCQFTRNISSEVGYQYYYDDFLPSSIVITRRPGHGRAHLLGEKSDQFSKAKTRFQSFKYCQRSKVKGNRKCRGKAAR